MVPPNESLMGVCEAAVASLCARRERSAVALEGALICCSGCSDKLPLGVKPALGCGMLMGAVRGAGG